METQLKTVITKDLQNKQIKITREFEASPNTVWNAWTDSDQLDQWWAPRPWKAETKKMDFREGGSWLYAMIGPEGTKAWCKVEYKTITPETNFTGVDCFCDENGNPSTDFPVMEWDCSFSESAEGTNVNVTISFDTEASLKKILEMGFEEGFTAAHANLDELLAKS